MRILFITSIVPEYTELLFKSIYKICKESYLIYLKKGPRTVTFKEDLSKNIFVLERPRILSLKNIKFMVQIANKIKKINPDIIHIQYSYPWFFLLFSLIKSKYVFTIHDVNTHVGENKYINFFNNLTIKHFSNSLIVHSKKLKDLFLKKEKNFNKPIYIIPHGNFSKYKPLKGIKDKKNQILFFGRIYEYKGLRYLIEAEPLIREKIKDFKIVIAGKGEDFSKYSKLIKNQDSFIIHNRFIPDEEMIKLFQESSFVVLPYIEASQSGVIPLAYQFKKPVIATDVGALSDVVIHKKTGLLIQPKNIEELANAIIYLISHPKEREIMGINGYNFSKKELSWDNIAKKTMEVYKNALNDKNNNPPNN